MSQQDGAGARARAQYSGLYVNAVGQRRAEFRQACADLFGQLALAEGAAQAQALLEAAPADLLVLDLERFELGLDLAALGALVAARAGAPVLVLCPFRNARWLPALMAFGPIDYAIGPLAPEQTRELLATHLARGFAPPAQPSAREAEMQALLAAGAAAQGALAQADDSARFAERLVEALAAWPGVAHAALFYQRDGDVHVEAERGVDGLHLGPLLMRGGERLLLSPLRHAFPGLLAAATGEFALLDGLEKAGEPELAASLGAHGLRMAVGLPIPADGPGAPRGALCLLFREPESLSQARLAAFDELAALAAFGLRMAELTRENEALLARVTQLATLDALTGAANRRHGETLLENEIRRARRYRLPLALIGFDIDRFSNINDAYGHPVGDLALRAVAELARALLRSSDVLVRAGGEEFLVIAPHTSAIDGLKMAEKLRAAIEQADIPGCDHLTISLGVAQLGETESGDSLALRVNAALARAKRAGRNCVELAMQ